MKLYVFNPDSDLALANNEENYVAPTAARRMTQDLALLPVWYAQPGSAVLAPSDYNADFLRQMQQLFPLPITLVTEPELPEYAEAQIMPWGWNLSIRKRLLKGGILERKLVTAEQLNCYRELSSRDVALDILSTFEGLDDCCGAGEYLSNLSDCEKLVQKHDWCVFKAPWSGSGRGLQWCRKGFTQPISNWCEGTLKKQGFLIGSPIYNKVKDFAMEFYSDGRGKVLFIGYSLFSTNSKGVYLGNELTRDFRGERWIEPYISLPSLVRIREHLLQQLTEVYGSAYIGYLGVDMMVCQKPDVEEYAVFPCVEINMRMNMGVVSHLFRENFMAPESSGSFLVETYSSHDKLLAAHEQDLKEFPLTVKDGKFVSGYLPLVPVMPKSLCRAYVMGGLNE